ncbi:PREDICTED: fatty acyl-CoA reductase 1-like [Wasmannia auropunctata]|uniref:fatty acyl-CoA reductase 1-like n=1 Tax=Wasmannia auropunctata TaxID=64793 RepID=UPI0005F01A0B|nr:PREDICTED: fatty acyl-CoA reductase 1-like [Wasmannia auropunctata]XP_011705652.1 PREDICTED: fatty acyl-CoA reductase 1-like [Wasmannia auropunctata]
MASQTDESQVRKVAESEIAQFFSGRKVLITIGLGFLGKLLIEKLLRCCPNIATLYIFVRGKDGKTPHERVQQLAEMSLYEKLKKEQPDFLQKLIVIESDLDTTNLGLSQQDRNRLLDANVIFHGATIVRSNQRLRTMTNVNVQATKQILLLAKEMRDLKAFVHLSTVFAHSPIRSIEEKHYPPPMETDELLSLVNILNDKKLDAITPTLIGGWPNTFAFTKAIAEDTVLRYSGDGMPVCIVRPSIVTSTWSEPIVGWAGSIYGPVGLLVSSSFGLLRTIHCHTDKNLDFVPADYVTSCLIAAAWCTSTRNTEREFKVDVVTGVVPDVERIPVYNYVSSCQRPITWDTFRKHVRAHGSRIPGVRDVRLQCMFWNSRLWVHKLLMCLFHLLPAVMADGAAILTGRDSRWYQIYDLIHAHLSATSYFMTQQWCFGNKAVVELWERMNAVDRETFEFDMSNFDWSEYIKRMLRGIRDFVSKTPWDIVEKGLAEYIEL